MEKYIIAGLKTEYTVRGELLKSRSEKYRADFPDSEVQIRLNVSDEFITEKQKQTPNLTWDEHEYMWTSEAFYYELLKHRGIMLHSSCVEKDGYAYLFSAKSGTGKSTHTHLWLKNLSGTRIINDDKPALLWTETGWVACGTPFSGSSDENLNVQIPVRAVVFIYRSKENQIKRLDSSRAITLFLEQTVKPAHRDLAENMLDNLDLLLRKLPVFALGCNMDDSAAQFSYSEIERLLNI